VGAGEGVGEGKGVSVLDDSTAVHGMWNLDQESSREFFRSFYRHLSASGKSTPKWRAFQAAQRELIRSTRESWRHCYHWALYIMIGDWNK
jgi:CHAT domain-containing protein